MDLSQITLQDCIELHEMKNQCVVVNDGKVVGIEAVGFERE